MLDHASDLDRVFKALSDANRRAIVARLSSGPASISELAKPLQISLAAVLQHVQVLEASGAVVTRKIGRTRSCSVNPAVLRTAESWLSDSRMRVERQLDRLGAYLSDEDDQQREDQP